MFKRSLIGQMSRLGFHTVATRTVPTRMLYMSRLINRTPMAQGINRRISVRGYAEHNVNSTFGNEIPEEVTNLTINDYHNAADEYLENLLTDLEELSEDYPNELPDVELNHGVMTLEISKLGPYVINKQPPNKQIWIASPVSGPNRFDLYQGEWVSLRNGLKLNDLITNELKQAIPDAKLINVYNS